MGNCTYVINSSEVDIYDKYGRKLVSVSTEKEAIEYIKELDYYVDNSKEK